nr:MAG TPA: Lysophospholipase [Caudoviricetes sp.]
MQKIRIDFDNPGLPQHISAVENDSQSRFFQATLYENGKAYTAPEGATYSIMYHGFGPQNQGWYDTINDGAGKRAACKASGNVVTCEIARQALQVPGHVSIVLCVTTGKGYMLKSWPIECDCKNDRYDSTVEIQSFFYITQVSNADWTQAIQAWENLKNTIDPTLSVSGKAADAAKVGEAVGKVKEDLGALNINDFDNTAVVSDKLNGVFINSSTGKEKISTGFIASGWIEVEENTTIVILEHFSIIGTTNVGLAFYDKTAIYISGVEYVKDTPTIALTPLNAKYMRFTVDASKKDTYKVYSIPTHNYFVRTEDYVPYIPKKYDYSYDAIGDSLTYGFIGFEGGVQKRLETPYPEKVKELLGLKTVYNNGQTGTTVANDIDKMGTYYPMSNDKRIEAYQSAAIVSVMGGVNDADKNVAIGSLNCGDETTFYGGYQKLIEALMNKTYLLLFIIVPPFSSINFNKATVIANATKEIANYYSIPVLDLFAIGKLCSTTKSTFTVDGTHFNQEYVNKIVAPYIANFIKENLVNE